MEGSPFPEQKESKSLIYFLSNYAIYVCVCAHARV